MILGGWGTGIVNPTMAAASLGVVRPSQGGIASGINSTFREVGQTAGIAVLGTLLQHSVRTHIQSSLAGTGLSAKATNIADAISGGLTQRVAATVPDKSIRTQLIHAAHVSYVAGLRQIFIVSGAVALIGAISTVLLVRGEDLKLLKPFSPPLRSFCGPDFARMPSSTIGTSRRSRLPVPLAVALATDHFPKSAESIAVCRPSGKGSSA
jgi:hypothetical protein